MRVDDLVTILDEIDKSITLETELRVVQTGLDAINSHLKNTAEQDKEPSRTVLEALLKVYRPEVN